MNYPEDHPLHGRDDKWMTEHACEAMRAIDEHHPRMFAVYETTILAALSHEYRRMESELDDRPVGWLRAPLDWLTRAIATSGAPEDCDWAGLLEHVKNLKAGDDASLALDAARCDKISDLKHQLLTRSNAVAILDSCAVELSMGRGELMTRIPEEVRKLRERADKSDEVANEWQGTATKIANLLGVHVHRDDLLSAVKALRERAEAAEYRADELDSADECATGLNRELCAILAMVPGGDSDGSLFGSEPGDGVAIHVRKKLDDDAARIKELTADRSKARAIALDRANIDRSTMAEVVDELVKLWAIYVKSDFEARDRASKAEAELESIHLRGAPTPPLDRIAADVSRIVAALERKSNNG